MPRARSRADHGDSLHRLERFTLTGVTLKHSPNWVNALSSNEALRQSLRFLGITCYDLSFWDSGLCPNLDRLHTRFKFEEARSFLHALSALQDIKLRGGCRIHLDGSEIAAACPRLARLQIGTPYMPLESSASSLDRLASLEELSLNQRCWQSGSLLPSTLTALNLSEMNQKSAELLIHALPKGLREFEFPEGTVTVEGIRTLLESCPLLTSLSFRDIATNGEVEPAAFRLSHPALQKVTTKSNLEIASAPNLRTLHAGTCRLAPECPRAFRFLSNLSLGAEELEEILEPFLTAPNLSAFRGPARDSMILPLCRAVHLKALTLTFNTVLPTTVSQLSALLGCLKHLTDFVFAAGLSERSEMTSLAWLKHPMIQRLEISVFEVGGPSPPPHVRIHCNPASLPSLAILHVSSRCRIRIDLYVENLSNLQLVYDGQSQGHSAVVCIKNCPLVHSVMLENLRPSNLVLEDLPYINELSLVLMAYDKEFSASVRLPGLHSLLAPHSQTTFSGASAHAYQKLRASILEESPGCIVID